MNKVPWWKQAIAWIMDEDWALDPYKIAAFLLLWQFSVVVNKVMGMVDTNANPTLTGIVAGLLVPMAGMVTFLFNYSKEHDKKLLDAAKEQ